jgi:hypothetical protein
VEQRERSRVGGGEKSVCRRMRQRSSMIAVGAVVAVVLQVPGVDRSLAADAGTGGVVDGVIFAGVQTSMSLPTQGTSSTYTWRRLTTHDAGIGRSGNISKVVDGIRYFLYERIGPDGTVLVWVAQATPRQLAQRAAVTVRSRLARPTVSMAPPPETGVVNASTWLWVDPALWVPVSAFAWIPGDTGPIWARTTATPVSIRFTSQDDGTTAGSRTGTVTCSGPGRAWQESLGDEARSQCAYTYQHSSVSRPGGVFEASVDVQWRISWTSNTGGGGSLPTERTTTRLSVRVDELQALVD